MASEIASQLVYAKMPFDCLNWRNSWILDSIHRLYCVRLKHFARSWNEFSSTPTLSVTHTTQIRFASQQALANQSIRLRDPHLSAVAICNALNRMSVNWSKANRMHFS